MNEKTKETYKDPIVKVYACCPLCSATLLQAEFVKNEQNVSISMKFEELSQELQENFLKLYKEHLKNSIDILNEDHWLEPILRINNQTEPTLVALQREKDTVDFDKMIEVVWDILRSHPFDTALLSYSTDVVLKDTSALVTYIIDKSGVGVLYFTAYHFKGLFRKKVVYDKHLLGEIIKNAL